MRLALLGVFGRTDDLEWIGTRTAHAEDVGPSDQKVFDRPGPPLCRFAVQCRSPRRYLPIANIILWREQIDVTEARRHMRSLPRELTIVGELVGGVYFVPREPLERSWKRKTFEKSPWLLQWLGDRSEGRELVPGCSRIATDKVYKLIQPELYQLKVDSANKVCKSAQSYPLVDTAPPSKCAWLQLD